MVLTTRASRNEIMEAVLNCLLQRRNAESGNNDSEIDDDLKKLNLYFHFQDWQSFEKESCSDSSKKIGTIITAPPADPSRSCIGTMQSPPLDKTKIDMEENEKFALFCSRALAPSGYVVILANFNIIPEWIFSFKAVVCRDALSICHCHRTQLSSRNVENWRFDNFTQFVMVAQSRVFIQNLMR